jgi:hypothetical protein
MTILVVEDEPVLREFAALFPDARVIRERVCGWTKSLVAVRAQSERNVT